MTNYSVTIGTEKFELNRSIIASLDIIHLGDGQYHLLRDDRCYKIEVRHTDYANKNITIAVNGNTYSAKIADEYDQILDKMGMLAARSHRVGDIRAPMPGLILEIMAIVGQEVTKGTPLIVLSAMKMENIIISPGAGTIKRIVVEIDKAVEKGELIIEME